ncbi:hypothetical protein NECAME_07009 [Necator americanus]|uniref:Secreted protein n=1 Tax=Necator americanus TaxID=51031 RepID=W2TQX9_NECAM|nr:hypothetical protein NECAME_07009 [Necator americanus]ETN84188.1 hypothetical protein NECAME_07009 [Necator americanus]
MRVSTRFYDCALVTIVSLFVQFAGHQLGLDPPAISGPDVVGMVDSNLHNHLLTSDRNNSHWSVVRSSRHAAIENDIRKICRHE